MGHSVVSVLYDQLSAIGAGNFGKLDRCFSRACELLSVPANDSERRHWRNMAFRYMRCTGHLDVSDDGAGITWCATPATLVEVREEFILIGNTADAERLQRLLGPERTSFTPGAESPMERYGVPFHPELLRVAAPAADVLAAAARSAIAVTHRYQERLGAALPSVERVIATVMHREPSSRGFEPDRTARLNLETGRWEPYAEPHAIDPGLYRRGFLYGRPEYVVASPSPQGALERFAVTAPEWALVVALHVLKGTLVMRYRRSSQRLEVAKTFHEALRLPTLVERLLRSGTLLSPASNHSFFTYGGITENTCRRLVTLMPFLQLEVSQ